MLSLFELVEVSKLFNWSLCKEGVVKKIEEEVWKGVGKGTVEGGDRTASSMDVWWVENRRSKVLISWPLQ